MAEYIPLKPNKRPLVKGWNLPEYHCSFTEAVNASQWIARRCDGLVVIDCDSTEAAEQWVKDMDETTLRSIPIVKTPRGYHFYYTWTPGSPDGPLTGVYKHIDVRVGHKSYVCVPPTPGYSHVRYEVQAE